MAFELTVESINMRKCLHKSLLLPVWIREPGSPLYQCAMTFVSESGAELMVRDPFTMPDRFDLLFSPIAQSWRECSIISRRYGAKSISISFLARHLPLHSGQRSLEVSKSLEDQLGKQK
jgi:hypothetical protein